MEPQLISFFNGGVNLRYQTTLDTANEGNFNTRSPENAIRLIENIATVRAFEKMSEKQGNGVKPNADIAEIRESSDSLYSLLTDQNESRVFKIEDNNPSNLEGQTKPTYAVDLHDQHTGFSDLSFTRRYDAMNSPYRKKIKSRLNQTFTGNQKIGVNMSEKIDLVHYELRKKIETLNEYIKRIDSQLAKIAIAIKREK